MKPIDFATLLLLAAIWGAAFLFIRVASPALGPLVLVDIRVFIAGGVVLLYALFRRNRLDLRRWGEFLLLGAVNAAIPFTLIAAAELTLTASFAAILNATTPIFTGLIASLWLSERVTVLRGVGLALGLVGVAVVVGWSPIPLTAHLLLAVAASLGAALSYGIGFVYTSRSFQDEPALSLNIVQQLAAGLILLPLALIHPPHAWPTLRVTGALLGLSLLGTTFAYFLYFRLIRRVGATSSATVTFLVPVFGLIWSVIFLQESIGPGLIVGLIIILASVSLVTGFHTNFRQRGTSPETARVP